VTDTWGAHILHEPRGTNIGGLEPLGPHEVGAYASGFDLDHFSVICILFCIEFRPNRSSHCGNMTSYRFINMAAAAAQYYFRFRICRYRCRLPSERQSLWANQILSTYLNWWLRHNYVVFEKQTFAILEIYFRFRPFARNMHIILHQATEFCQNRSTHCGNMMAAATAEYYFRFFICWCHCLQNVRVY